MSPRGRFITLEGGDGAGKSTQIARLSASLRAAGLEVVETREPGGAPGAEAIRGLLLGANDGQRFEPLTEALLMFAARAEHLAHTIRPALERGAWVVCDRFIHSTIAYQGYGLGLDLKLIEELRRLVVGSDEPDLTLILDLPVEIGLARAEARGAAAATRYERLGPAFHERLRAGFLALAQAEPQRCVVIDASAEAKRVAAHIGAAVEERLGPGTVFSVC